MPNHLPLAGALLALLAIVSMAAAPPPNPSKADAEREIWALEQAIYAARGRGDLTPYITAAARDYKAWPPFRTAPAGVEGLRQLGAAMATQTQEKLEMRFVSLALSGDAAVIYYQTHRTMLPDGTPADERFDVTHTWAREDGRWKVLGGMARARASRAGAR
jgi:ketosteroid isomerase-like protein